MVPSKRYQPHHSRVALAACAWIAITVTGPAIAVPDYNDPQKSGFYSSVQLAQPDGRLLIGGLYYDRSVSPPGRVFGVERLNGDGAPDLTFNGSGFAQFSIWGGHYEFVSAFAFQPDGKIIVGGNAENPMYRTSPECAYGDCYNPALIRLNPDGTLDRSFNGTGKLILAIGNANDGYVQRYGTLDGLALQPDGRIVIRSGNTPTARVNADGTLDLSFVGTDQVAREVDTRPSTANGLTGSWFNPAQNGHGFALEVLPGQSPQLLASWMTFAPQTGQAWIVGVGPLDGNRAVLQAHQSVGTGGRFPPTFDAANVHQERWGTLTFTFSDCSHGHVEWVSSVPGYGSGGMELLRLTLPAGLTCSP